VKTQEYLQPTFYHFSQTTIEAAQWVSQYLQRNNFSFENLIDLFAGSGIFSIEFLNRMPKCRIKQWYLVEMQNEFENSLRSNCVNLEKKNNGLTPQIVIKDSLSWLKDNDININEQDLVLLNPPYFFTEEGKNSIDPCRAKCLTISRQYWYQCIQQIGKSKAKYIMMLNNSSQLYLETFIVIKNKIRLIQPLAGNEVLILIN
jgi:16S rRNA G966 N2-methylase RsmD